MNENQSQQEKYEQESIKKTYNDFMEWFEINHPDLFQKYARNITVPFQSGGGVGITMNYKISTEEHKMLYEIARTFYHPSNSKKE